MISIQLFTNIRKGVYGNFLNHKNYLRKCFILKSNIRYYSIDINDKLEYEKVYYILIIINCLINVCIVLYQV